LDDVRAHLVHFVIASQATKPADATDVRQI